MKNLRLIIVSLLAANSAVALCGTIEPPVVGIPPSVCVETTSYTLGGDHSQNLINLAGAESDRLTCLADSITLMERFQCNSSYQDDLYEISSEEIAFPPVGGAMPTLSWGNQSSNQIVIYETRLYPCA